MLPHHRSTPRGRAVGLHLPVAPCFGASTFFFWPFRKFMQICRGSWCRGPLTNGAIFSFPYSSLSCSFSPHTNLSRSPLPCCCWPRPPCHALHAGFPASLGHTWPRPRHPAVLGCLPMSTPRRAHPRVHLHLFEDTNFTIFFKPSQT